MIGALVTIAFSDVSLYTAPVTEGGGAGRFFTGSRVDGYACSVCHRGATTEEFVIDPLPEHLEAGRRYDIVVHWTDATKPHSVHLELSNPDGSNPAVMIPAIVPPQSKCSMPAGMSALYTVDVGVRRIVGVEPCGAQQLTASFVATGKRIELAVAAVRGDASDTADGDATFERRITFDGPAPESGGCQTSGGSGLAVGLLVLLRSRRRRAA